MSNSGLYIVALKSEEEISVNAHDPRIADRCLKVSRLNCKVGKAANLAMRERNYWKTFGRENVVFAPIVYVKDFAAAERVVLRSLSEWRVRGPTGRKNEWLAGIEPAEVQQLMLAALTEAAIPFSLASDS